MSYSVNTNAGALVALQNLSMTQAALQKTQNIISTGKTVNTAQDNGAVWSIANTMSGRISALDSVTQSLNRATSTADVAMSAGQQVSDLLTQLKSKALAASDTSLDATSRASMNQDFKSLLGQITTIINNASFNGTNILNSTATNIYALASDTGTKLTVQAQNLSLGGTILTIAAAASFATAAAASAYVTTLNTDITNLNSALATIGTGATAVANQLKFVQGLQSTLQTGVSNLVDADMASESAQLQALQTKQQLGIQALSIANQSPQIILSLFK
ncbi:MAG TPA: flagellin [Caulobacteraceae bacterium]|nr:flagellin [Caulobacteraceae bacterium]